MYFFFMVAKEALQDAVNFVIRGTTSLAVGEF